MAQRCAGHGTGGPRNELRRLQVGPQLVFALESRASDKMDGLEERVDRVCRAAQRDERHDRDREPVGGSPSSTHVPISSRSLASMIMNTSVTGSSTVARTLAFRAIDSSGAPGIRMIAAAIARCADVRDVETERPAARAVEAVRLADALADRVAGAGRDRQDRDRAGLDRPSANTVATRVPAETVQGAPGSPRPPAPGNPRRRARTAPRRRSARRSRTPPRSPRRRSCRSDHAAGRPGVRPLSTDALCWKKIIHGVTVAPIVEATSSSSVLKLPPGIGEAVRNEWPTAPQWGRP